VLEVISDDPDRDILVSVQRLMAVGFAVPPPAKKRRVRSAKTATMEG